METKYKITIPEPCQEDWNAMTPNDKGRFCSSCAKTVIDFSVMLPDEIDSFFIQNYTKNICGRFKKTQLDNLVIQIPSYVLHSQTQYHKIFLLALFITMGTTLCSCSDKKGNKQKIDTIEIVEKVVKTEDSSSTLTSNPKKNIKKPSVAVVEIYDLVETITAGNGYSQIIEPTIAGGIQVSGGLQISVEPEYPGGRQQFFNLFTNEFKSPRKEKRVTGEVQMSFVIEKDGVLSNIKPIKEVGSETTQEIIRALSLSNKWRPGFENGKAIRRQFLLSIPIEKDSLNEKRRKRKFSKIGELKLTDYLDTIDNQEYFLKKEIE